MNEALRLVSLVECDTDGINVTFTTARVAGRSAVGARAVQAGAGEAAMKKRPAFRWRCTKCGGSGAVEPATPGGLVDALVAAHHPECQCEHGLFFLERPCARDRCPLPAAPGKEYCGACAA
jgi:hypothetical protein